VIRGTIKWQSSLTAMRTPVSLMTWIRIWIFAALNSVSSILPICTISPMKIGGLIWQVSGVTTVHGGHAITQVIKGNTR
jgi:hypothetical protein